MESLVNTGNEFHKVINQFICSISGDECVIVKFFDSSIEECMLLSDYVKATEEEEEEEEIKINPNWIENLSEWEQGYYLIG